MSHQPVRPAALDEAEALLGVEFGDRGLLALALVHSSYANENPDADAASNERLEFLGDGFINFVVAHHLYEKAAGAPEGELTAWRSLLVRGETLAGVASRLALGQLLVMGRGEEAGGGRERATNLADAFEAVVGALLLDKGYVTARAFVLRCLEDDIDSALRSEPPKDPKSRLQELLQSAGREVPRYDTVASDGPDGAPWFIVQVSAGDRVVGQGAGRRKVDAERAAASSALEKLAGGDAGSGPG